MNKFLNIFVGILIFAQFSHIEAISVKWCDTTAAHGTVYEAFLYVETCIPLCVYMDQTDPSPPPPSPLPPSPPPPNPSPPPSPSGNQERRTLLQTELLNIRATSISEAYPVIPDSLFPYPYEEVNYPPSGKLVGDPAAVTTDIPYCFTPTEVEECAYTVCFEGFADEEDTTVLSSEVRCYRVEVYNEVMVFDGDDEAVDNDVSRKMLPRDGLTMSAWVYPECTKAVNVNQTIMYFGSNRNFATQPRDEGFEVRNGIKWHVDESGAGSFYYHDCNIGSIPTPAQYFCGVWHYVAVSLSPQEEFGFLYVDGIKAGHEMPNSRDLYTYSVTAFNTSTFPDNGMDRTSEGVFKIGHYPGEGFVGMIDEVRVWNYSFTAEQIFADSVDRTLLPIPDPTVKAYFTMTTSPYTPITSAGAPQIIYKAIPTMIPCVLGMEHNVGPVDGNCNTEIYGWSFSDSLNPQCSIAGVPQRAKYVSDEKLICSTPGHFSPRFATVLATNNGLNFTSTYGANKTTLHLYMESSLYLQGGNNVDAGASADQVCEDFTKGSQAVTVSAWSCPKCGPPKATDYSPQTLNLPCSKETC